MSHGYEGFHVYGSRSAFRFEMIKDAKKADVLSIDAAPIPGPGAPAEAVPQPEPPPAERAAPTWCAHQYPLAPSCQPASRPGRTHMYSLLITIYIYIEGVY